MAATAYEDVRNACGRSDTANRTCCVCGTFGPESSGRHEGPHVTSFPRDPAKYNLHSDATSWPTSPLLAPNGRPLPAGTAPFGQGVPANRDAGPGSLDHTRCMGPLRCVIVDDSHTYVEVARKVLTQQGLSVVGVASSRAEAVIIVADVQPDVVLIDVNLGDESGFDLVNTLLGAHEATSMTVILTSIRAEEDLSELIAASPAAGFVAKTDLSASIVRDFHNARFDDDSSGGFDQPS